MDSHSTSSQSWKEHLCFTFALDTQKKRKRAKFDQSRKSEVATVRRKGACLRCRLLKASCSETRPCDNCLRAKHSSYILVHKWMDCVSVSLREVNVFMKALPAGVTGKEAKHSIMSSLTEVPICLCGESQIVWSLDWLTVHIAQWVENRKSLGFSRTGMLASPQLQKLLEPFLGPQVSSSLRSLMLSTMMAYHFGEDAVLAYVSHNRQAFHLERAVSADKVLRYLEETLTPAFLTKPSKDQQRIQALTILAFGVMRSLAYVDDTELSLFTKASDLTTLAEHGDTTGIRDQLAIALSHFLVLLIEKLGLACLRDSVSLILENVQKHSLRSFILPLPIPVTPLDGVDRTTPPAAQIDEFESSTPSVSGLSGRWARLGDAGNETHACFGTSEAGDDLQQILSNDLDALSVYSPADQCHASSQRSNAMDPYRQCIVCTSPLRFDEQDLLCIACQQPPQEVWPGNRTIASSQSSPFTHESSRGVFSGQNSLSTSLTSQNSSVFDSAMASRERCAARPTLPYPVEEESEECGWIFDAEDMDFENDGASVAGSKEFPPGWSLYWDDSCDEQSEHEDIAGV